MPSGFRCLTQKNDLIPVPVSKPVSVIMALLLSGTSNLKRRTLPRAPPRGSGWDETCHCSKSRRPYLLPAVKELGPWSLPTGYRMIRPNSGPSSHPQDAQ